ncbi:cytochrome P450 [Lentzea sp. NPDC042327]|uniref:cytochrome P450 n=1 Tax=Lentzea sp. NPDC042327 TaxID=3154801 RepID=UPI0033DCB134
MAEHTPRFAYPLLRTSPVDPPEEYAQLRREQPVCPVSLATGDPGWIVTRHDDARVVLNDRRFSREAVFLPGVPKAQHVLPDPNSMLSMDPPRHTRLRKLANPTLTAAKIDAMRPHLQKVTDELLDGLAAQPQPADLLEHLARPLALRMICSILGVPFADHHLFGGWTDRFMSLTKYPGEEIAKANADMRAYFAKLIEDKRAEPGDDMISSLVAKHDSEGDETITETEIVSLGVLLLLAGHDTTVTVLGSSVVTLVRNPDQLAMLLEDPSLYPAAVNEMVRLNGLGGGTSIRVTVDDVELSGVKIPSGSAVIASVASGCRDESVIENPDTCDITRAETTQLGFGFGPHFCIGANLAKAELEIALRGLFDRFPGLRVAVPLEELRWKDYAALGGWEELPVAWD